LKKDVQVTLDDVSANVQKTGNGTFNFFSAGFKKAFGNVIGHYKKAATDGGNSAVAANKDAPKKIETDTKASQDKIRSSIIDSTQKTAETIFSIMTKSNDARRNYEVAKDEKARKLAIAAAGNDKAAVAAINHKYDRLENIAKNKAFKADQNIAIGAIVEQTAAQLAVISKQQPPALAKGGYFKSEGKGRCYLAPVGLMIPMPPCARAKR
jgi:Spy/CpxP family protein refolding chaperone